MNNSILQSLLCAFTLVVTAASTLGANPVLPAAFDTATVKKAFEEHELKVSPDAAKAIQEFLANPKFKPVTDAQKRRAAENFQRLIGGIATETKRNKETTVTVETFEKVKGWLCPGLWPFC